MKKTLKKIAIIFLSAGLFAACANSSDDPTAPANNTNAEASKTEVKVEEGLNVPLTTANFAAWDSERASFQNNVLSLKTNNKDGGAGNGASFWFEPNQNAGDYKYAKFSYESLDVPNVNLRLKYSDGSYSEVYLQSHLTEVYIELDASKKTAIKEINLMTRQSQSQIGAEKSSFTVKGLSFVKEKNLPQKAALVDAKTGSFNDSISVLEISNKIGFGYSLGNGLSRVPFYEKDGDYKTYGQYTGYGFQYNYGSDNKPLKMNLSDQNCALGNQTGGLALELYTTPLVTKDFIDAVKARGFSSIRICVTWYPHIIDKNYTIDPYFMERVKQIVDWAISDGLYVLLNEHHSIHAYCPRPLKYADGYNLAAEDIDESKKYLEAIYRQICQAFNGSYDEHLIFETLNEPRVIKADGSEIWATGISDNELQTASNILNDYNKLILDTIRKSGGNNAKRFIMLPTYATDYSTIDSKYFKLPEDSVSNKLMLAIHWYPLGFNSDYSSRNNYSPDIKQKFEERFAAASNTWISKGIPVCITEYGIENNDTYQLYHKYFPSSESDRSARQTCLFDFCQLAGKYGLSLMAWDDGCVHSVVKRFAPFDAYDGDDFLKTLKNSWKNARSENPILIFLTPSQTDLPSSGIWGSADVAVTGVAEGNVIKLGLSKIAGASYSQIRICPKGDSWTSLAMNSISVENNAAELENANPETDGKNIKVNADSAIVSYTLTSEDCNKINSSGGIALRGFGVKITSVSLIK